MPLILFLLAWAHGLLWAQVTPIWQAPDEPVHFEYVRLVARGDSQDLPQKARQDLQQEIIKSMAENDFWRFLGGREPEPLPGSFDEAEDKWLGRAGTQVTDEPILYYLIPSLLCRWLDEIGSQVIAIRAYSAMLTAGVVVLAWLAAGQLMPDDHRFALTTAAWLGLQPMVMFIGASVNNDALVMLVGAAFAYTLIVGSRRGWPIGSVIALIGLATLLPFTKKSGIFAPPLALGVLIAAMRVRLTRRLRRVLLLALIALIVVLATVASLAVSGQAAAWARRGTVDYNSRTSETAHTGSWSLQLPAVGHEDSVWIVQTVPSHIVREHSQKPIGLSLWAKSSAEGSLHVVVDDGELQTSLDFELAREWQQFEVEHALAPGANRLRVVLAPASIDAQRSAIFIDDLSVISKQGELLRNGSAEAAKRRLEGWTAGYLRLPIWFTGALSAPASYGWDAFQRYGLGAAITFASFWGNFGWLTLPLPVWAYVLLAAVTLVALWGCIRLPGLLSSRWQNRSVRYLAAQAFLVTVITLVPMIGRDWYPQGRYLFPALVPFALLFTGGWWALGRRHRKRQWWTVVLLVMVSLDMMALFGVLIPHYRC